MKQKKRILSLLMVVIMTITQLPYSNLGIAKANDGNGSEEQFGYKLIFKDTISNSQWEYNEETNEYEEVIKNTYNYYYIKYPKTLVQGNDFAVSFVSVGKEDTTDEPTADEIKNSGNNIIYFDQINILDKTGLFDVYKDVNYSAYSEIASPYYECAKDANGAFSELSGKKTYELQFSTDEYSYQNVEKANDLTFDIEWISRGTGFTDGGFGEKKEKVAKDSGSLQAPLYNFAEGADKEKYQYVYTLEKKSSASNEWITEMNERYVNGNEALLCNAFTDGGYATQYRFKAKLVYSYYNNDTWSNEEIEIANYESGLFTVVKSEDFYNSNPVAFIDPDNTPQYVSTELYTELVVAGGSENIALTPTDVVYDENKYDVKFQWSSSEDGAKYDTIEGATEAQYVLKKAPDKMTRYKLTATAYEKKSDGTADLTKAAGTAVYNFDVYVRIAESIFNVSEDSTWIEPDNHNTRNDYDEGTGENITSEEEYSNSSFTANVGDQVSFKLGVDVKDKEKYEIESVKLQKCTYVNNADGSIAETEKWVDVENKAAADGKYSYTTEALKSSDFFYQNTYKSGEATVVDYGKFVPTYKYVVVAVNKATKVKCKAEFKVEINEYTGTYQALETVDRTEKTIEAQKDKAVTLKAPAFKIVDDSKNAIDKFKAAYKWEKYDAAKEKYVEVKATDNITMKDNVLSIAKYSSDCAGLYRLSVSKMRSDDTPVVGELPNRFIYTLMDVQAAKNEDIEPHAYRATARSFAAAIYSKVELGVNISPEVAGYTATYVWIKNGEVQEKQTNNTFVIDSVKENDFGSYECDVTFKKDGKEYTDKVDFIVDEANALVISTPQNTMLKNKKIGEKAVMTVDTTGSKGTITYRWYKRNADSAINYTRVKDSDTVDASFTIDALKAEDFTEYVCVVSNGRNVDIRTFIITAADNTVELKNSVVRATPYTAKRQLGDSVEMRVDSKLLDGYTLSCKWTKTIKDGAYNEGYYYDDYTFGYADYEELVERADGNALKIQKVENSDYGEYTCYPFVKETATGITTLLPTIRFKLAQCGVKEESGLEIVKEYGYDGANRVGDTVRFGYVDNTGKYGFRWKFTKCISNATGSDELLNDFVQDMGETSAVITKKLTENDFGIYYVEAYDKETGELVDYTEFNVVKYTGRSGLISIGVKNIFGSELQRNIGEKAEMAVDAFTQRQGETLTYRWYYMDENSGRQIAIDGATSSVYTIDAVSYSDYGRYICEVSDGTEYEVVDFNVVERSEGDICSLGYKGGGVIVRNQGTALTLDPIVIKGSKELTDLTYVWTKNDVVLKSHEATYTIDALTADDYGTYTFRAYYGSKYVGTDFIVVRPSDDIRFDKSSASAITAGSVEDYYVNDAEDNATGKSTLIILPNTKGNVDVTLSAKAATLSGRNIKYSWSKFDNIQNRWVQLASTDATCTITGLNYDNIGETIECTITTEDELDKWTYTASIEGSGYSFEKKNFGVSVFAENRFAVDGRNVDYYAEALNEDEFGYTYQWYDYDDDDNLVIVPGETGKTYTSKVTEKDVKNGYKKTPVVFYNVSSNDKLDNVNNKKSDGSSIQVISAIPQKEYPSESIYGDYNSSGTVQAYSVQGASSVTYLFDKAYSLGGFASLYVADADGRLVKAFGVSEMSEEWSHDSHYDKPSVSETEDPVTVTVPSDTAYFVFFTNGCYVPTNDNMRNNIMKLGYKVANLGTDPGKITLLNTSLTMDAGKSEDVTYTIKDMEGNAGKDSDITVVSSDANIATAKINNGKITVSVPASVKGASKATITVKYGESIEKIGITVTNPLEKIAASKSSLNVKVGKTATLTFTVTANNQSAAFNPSITQKDFKFSTSSKYVTVSKVKYKVSKGKIVVTVTIKAKTKGTTKLTAKVGGKTKKVKIKIKK